MLDSIVLFRDILTSALLCLCKLCHSALHYYVIVLPHIFDLGISIHDAKHLSIYSPVRSILYLC